MIRGYTTEEGRLRLIEDPLAASGRVVWFDLVEPTDTEEQALEALLGIGVPTRDEMEEIEETSRLYVEDGATFMTARLTAQVGTGDPIVAPVTFILAGSRLITVRYHSPRAFELFPARAEKVAVGCTDGATVLLALLETIVDRLADVLETCGTDNDAVAREILRDRTGRQGGARDYRAVLQEVGRLNGVASYALDSLVTLERLIAFVGPVAEDLGQAKENRARLKALARDTRFLESHAHFLSQKIDFLLEATLGMVSIEQNAIIKMFSVAAVVFMPPTLIASIYGMNFRHMPELGWGFGYPLALGMMALSVLLSLWFFKSRRWL